MPPQAPGDVAGERPATPEEIISAFAKKHKVAPALALAVARRESGMNPNAVGDLGKAIGTFQLHAGAAKDVGLTPADRLDPMKNIEGGVQYLRQLSDRYGGDINKTLMAYNGGMGNVDNDTVSPQAQAYAAEVIAELSRGMRPSTTPAGAPTGPRGGRSAGAGPGPSPALIKGTMGTPGGFVRELAEPFDPRTPEGRVNLASTAGSVAGSMLTRGLPVGTLATRALQVLGPAVGAGMAGATEAGVERTIAPSPDAASPLSVGMTQAGYELGGQAFLWPIRRFVRTMIAPRLAGKTAEALKTEAGVVRQRGRDLIDLTKQQTEEATAAARDIGAAQVRGVKSTGAARLSQLELDNSAQLREITKQYDNLLAHPPSTLGAGTVVRQVLEGPSKRALDIAGRRVAEAAEKGPMIDLAPVKAALSEMAAATRPAAIFGAEATEQPGIGFLRNLQASHHGTAAAATMTARPEEHAILNQKIAQALGIPVERMDPRLPGLLGRIQSAEGPITFADAHKIKMLLDEAVNWDRTAKRHLERITKGLRQTLREQMADFQPYNDATAAYQAVVPLYRRGIGRQIITAARDNPSRVVRLLKGNDPAGALALRQLLVDQAAAGGDAQLGQQAWDAVRGAYTHEELLTGGIEKLASRLDDLLTTRPEFVRAVYGDANGVQVLRNLSQLADAYTTAVTQGATRIAEAKVAGKAAVESTRAQALTAIREAQRTGRSRVQAATRAAQQGREQVAARTERFKESTLSKFTRTTVENESADVVRAAALGLRSYWGGLSMLRLLRSPSAADVLEWAAYSNYNTGRLARMLTSPVAPEVAAGVWREIGHHVFGAAAAPVSPAAPTEATMR